MINVTKKTVFNMRNDVSQKLDKLILPMKYFDHTYG